MKIALTKSNTGFQQYINWLKYFKVDFMIFDWEEKTPIELFDNCNGLILTGGTDVYPGLYNDLDDINTDGVYTPGRDSYEIELIENALKSKKPILGICRGNQLLNVYFKGNLISDLEKEKGVNHSRISDNRIKYHEVNVIPGSMLAQIVKENIAKITSTHHQAIDKPGEGLMINAISTDGVNEGIEYSDKSGKAFLLGMQWHPELFDDYNNPFSKDILMKFLEEVKK
jgi:putative glutamine amidotransferase